MHDFLTEVTKQLANRCPGIQNQEAFLPSAVLLPFVERDGEWGILFEVRAANLSWQPGEICFPGGRIELQDASPKAAAIRETCEELGIAPEAVQVLGQLDHVLTPLGLMIYPFAGCIADSNSIRHNPDEVAETFVVPFTFFMEHEPQVAVMETATRPHQDFPIDLVPDMAFEWRRRSSYKVLFYRYKERVIWGITAGIVHHFVKLLKKRDI
ncbi:MAG: nudL [Firmicutes bacterium]|nr:nudL [Bacillota bacterium]